MEKIWKKYVKELLLSEHEFCLFVFADVYGIIFTVKVLVGIFVFEIYDVFVAFYKLLFKLFDLALFQFFCQL